MRMQVGKSFESYLARFTDEIMYHEQVIDGKVLSALRDGLNMNTLFWRDVQNKNPTSYDAFVEMMRSEIVKRNLLTIITKPRWDFHPPHRQKRCPISHLVNQQWTQGGYTIAIL